MPKDGSLDPVLAEIIALKKKIRTARVTKPVDKQRQKNALKVLSSVDTLLRVYCEGGFGSTGYYQYEFPSE